MASTGSMTGMKAAVSLIALAATAQALPHTSKRAAPFTRQGCFVDNANNQRLFGGASYASDDMSIESCAAFCAKNKYFGVEYGRECYCSDTLTTTAVDDADCSKPCSGNSNEKCGNGDRLDVYINDLFASRKVATLPTPYLGCFVDQGARVLPDNLLGADDMTAQKCAANCANYSYFGVEFGRECWCGNSPPKTAAPEAECSKGCAGDDTQICGGGNRINVWGAPLPSQEIVGDYEYLGCFTDKGDDRSLRGPVSYDPAMTLEKCASFCSLYSYFGVEVGSQCYCGTILEDLAAQVPQAECSARCGGAYGTVCGDVDRLNVYVSSDCKEDPANVDSVAGFTYKSCHVDNAAGRVLTAKELRSDTMTVEACAAFCQGSQYFGVEYGRECYCGDVLTGATAPEGECNQVCKGDATEWCGAADRLNVYAAAPAAPATTTVPDVPTTTVTPPAEVTTA